MSRSGRQAKPRPAASHRAGARENGRAPSPPGSGGGSENRRAQRGTTSTVMPRAEGRPMSPPREAVLQVPQCLAPPCGSSRGGWFLFKSR